MPRSERIGLAAHRGILAIGSAVVVVLVVGCSSAGSPPPGPTTTPRVESPPAESTSAPSFDPSPAVHKPSTATPPPAVSPSESNSTIASTSIAHALRLDSITPRAKPGDEVELQLTLVAPEARVDVEVYYPDSEAPVALTQAFMEGWVLRSWRWTVPEDAHPGEATVVASARMLFSDGTLDDVEMTVSATFLVDDG